MRILQLCPRVPWPLTDGGRIGIFHITKHLAMQGHAIDMIAFAEDDTTAAHVAALEQYCTVRLVKANIRTNIPNFLRSVVRNESVYITRHRSDEFLRAVRDALAHTKYDAVYGDHSAMFPYLVAAKKSSGIPTAARLHNIESVIWKRYARDERNPVKRLIAARQAAMLEAYEARSAEQVDVNFTITDVDRERLERLAPRARVTTVFPGVDAVHWAPQARPEHSTIAVTATTFSWIHNVSGVHWFLDRVMPRVRERVPGFSLELLGRCPPASLQRRAGADVKVLGFVDVVPLHVGSGIRIKILEAMAMGMPVVTTAVGCEGIGATDGVHYFIADTPEAFAEAVVTVLTNPERARAVGRAARAFVVEKFNWDTAASRITGELAAIIARRALEESSLRG